MQVDEKFVKQYDALIRKRIESAKVPMDIKEDLVGLVYERILTSNNYNPEKGKITTWLWHICNSVISNEVKKHKRSQDVLDVGKVSLEAASQVIGQEDAGTTRDELERVFDATDLSHRDKAIVKLHYIQGLTTDELAVRYDVGKRAIEQIIFRAMKALRATAQA